MRLYCVYKSVCTTLISYQQVPLGIIMKNENKVDEMVSIMSTLHQYHEATIRQCSSSWVIRPQNH